MKPKFEKYIIIGAGLSGLTAGYVLQEAGESSFHILESRDRLGGRILTKDAIDFGATWFQNHHEAVAGFLETLGIEKFQQYTKGKSVLVYNTMAPAHEFESDPNAPSAYRIAGGTKALINGLAANISENIQLSTTVSEILKTPNGVRVITNQGSYEAKKVLVCMPPRIASKINYSPNLPESLLSRMHATHTWMSNAIKVGIHFKTPFWRNKNYSGTLIGQVGAVTELYDHTCHDTENFTLMGFVNEGLRELTPDNRKKRILAYIAKFLGDEVYDFDSYEEKDWSQDPHTSCEQLQSVYISPQYGKPEFQQTYLDGCLFFSGAETAAIHGGYMDGAIRSGILAANKLLKE